MIKFAPTTQTPAQTPSTAKDKSFSMVSGQNDRMAGSVPVWSNMGSFAENIADAGKTPGKDKSFGLSDIIDIVNPLQHIPVVSNLYQSATGDTMGSIAQIVGGAMFGGPIGALVSAGMVVFDAATESEKTGSVNFLDGTTIALADMRQGYKPYNA